MLNLHPSPTFSCICVHEMVQPIWAMSEPDASGAQAQWTLDELRHTAYQQEGEVDSETRQLAATEQETRFLEHEAQRFGAEAREEESKCCAIRDDLARAAREQRLLRDQLAEARRQDAAFHTEIQEPECGGGGRARIGRSVSLPARSPGVARTMPDAGPTCWCCEGGRRGLWSGCRHILERDGAPRESAPPERIYIHEGSADSHYHGALSLARESV